MSLNISQMIDEKIAELQAVRALLVEVETALRPLSAPTSALLADASRETRRGTWPSRVGPLKRVSGPLGGGVPLGPVVVAPRSAIKAIDDIQPADPSRSHSASLDDLVRELKGRGRTEEEMLQ